METVPSGHPEGESEVAREVQPAPPKKGIRRWRIVIVAVVVIALILAGT
jgi:hypothetical protein